MSEKPSVAPHFLLLTHTQIDRVTCGLLDYSKSIYFCTVGVIYYIYFFCQYHGVGMVILGALPELFKTDTGTLLLDDHNRPFKWSKDKSWVSFTELLYHLTLGLVRR